MKSYITLIFLLVLLFSCGENQEKNRSKDTLVKSEYLQNRTPLKPLPYLELPLGAIKPEGWLKEQLERMASGLTGNLDEIYPEVVGSRNGWLGGDGDGWERGPYWIDGLLPLAYILDDPDLKAKVKPWIEWTLDNQTAEGYIGPTPFDKEPEHESGLQRGQRKDWWPKMVMLKILQQYYNATGDNRVIDALSKYFKYQLKELPDRPLDDLTFWANRRGGDNLQVVYWLYNITGDKFLLELAEIIQIQTFPWTTVFLNEPNLKDSVVSYKFFQMKGYPFDSMEIKNTSISQIGSIHTVNFAQGLKQPIVQYQNERDTKYVAAVKKGLRDIEKYHGQPQGMYGGDEPLHGTDPVQGVEFCSISEEMFSLETILKITGDMEFADLLERIAYNALPTQASDDFTSRQYFQAANQGELSDRLETSFETESHKGTDFVYGILSGYPCCTTNMHQSWPKFVQNLYYATPDGGAAALLYAPSTAHIKVANGVDLKITETTGFPFRENVAFEFGLSQSARFPFHLRIPSWTRDAVIKVNEEIAKVNIRNNSAIVDREWKDGDKITLTLPMRVTASKWHMDATALERGPLVYALKIRGEERTKNRNDGYGEFTEIYPMDDWNYGLLQSELNDLSRSIEVIEKEWDGGYPWNLENAPIALKIKAKKLPNWKLVNGAPTFPDFSDVSNKIHRDTSGAEVITLVPYGCTTLRITEFPTIKNE